MNNDLARNYADALLQSWLPALKKLTVRHLIQMPEDIGAMAIGKPCNNNWPLYACDGRSKRPGVDYKKGHHLRSLLLEQTIQKSNFDIQSLVHFGLSLNRNLYQFFIMQLTIVLALASLAIAMPVADVERG
jgi:hypothetical protein